PDSPGLIDATELLSLERILSEWKVWKEVLDCGDFDGVTSEPQDGIKDDWWNQRWVPLTYDGSGNHLCLDCDPGEGGANGQIITMWHDSAERELISASFEGWMNSFAADLENDRYEYSEEYGGLIQKDDRSGGPSVETPPRLSYVEWTAKALQYVK